MNLLATVYYERLKMLLQTMLALVLGYASEVVTSEIRSVPEKPSPPLLLKFATPRQDCPKLTASMVYLWRTATLTR